MTRASMSAVTPGKVAPRAPLSLARLRAWVWESDLAVGARKTSARARAAARGAGSSLPWLGRSVMRASTASPPAASASARIASPSSRVVSSTTTSTSSPAATLRQSRTTVVTAR